MPISIQCPNPACAKTSVATEGIEGKRVRCKHCGQSFTASGSTSQDDSKSDSCPSIRSSRQAELPATIGRFAIRSRLGAGAFGTVYRAYDPQLDREVALKVPNPGTLDHPKRVERFLREARAAAGLRHPHIVPIFDAGQDGGVYYIASAFIAGKKLGDTFDEKGADLERAARLTRELAEALAYAHEQGIVHRDVKPDNIMVDGGDHIHLMDFGLASRQDEESKLTSDGAVMGTPGYMAPEQASGQTGDAQPAADQYSVGIVLYEMLTGRVPFEGPVAVVIHNQIHTEPDRPSALREGIPKDLETICLKALSKRPEDRYEDCQEMADDLRRWGEGEPITARRMSAAERFGRWVRKNKAISLVSGLAAAFLVVGIVATSIFAIWAFDEAARADAETEATKAALQKAQDNELRANGESQRADTEVEATKLALLKARESEKLATDEKNRADQALGKARESETVATNEKNRADQEVRATRAALDEAELNLSQSKMVLSQVEWDTRGDMGNVYSLLDGIPRKHRAFEWHFAKRNFRSDLFAVLGHKASVTSVAYSPDGNRIASASLDKTIRVIDAKTGSDLLQIKGHTDFVTCVTFSKNGKIIASASNDRTVKLWSSDNGKNLLTLSGHAEGVTGVALSPDGKIAASSSTDSTLRIWDTASGKITRVCKTNFRSKSNVSISPDGQRVACGDYQNIKIWDIRSGTLKREIKCNFNVESVQYAPDSQRIVAAGFSGASVYDEKSGIELCYIYGHTGNITNAIYSPDGKTIGTSSNDKSIRLWDSTSGKNLLVLKGHSGVVTCICFSPDGRRIASGGGDASVRLWDPFNDQPSLRIMGSSNTGCLKYSSDGTRILSVRNRRFVEIWDAESGKQLKELGEPSHSSIRDANYSPDGTKIVSCSGDEYMAPAQIFIWDANTGQKIRALTGHPSLVSSVTFSPDGTKVLANSGESVLIWDINTEDSPKKFSEKTGSTGEACFSPDGNTIVSFGGHGLMKIWKIASGQKISEHNCGSRDGHCVAYSPIGDRIAIGTGGSDCTIQIWDVRQAKVVLELKGHTGVASKLISTADGTRLISSAWDGTLRIWDLKSGRQCLQYRPSKSHDLHTVALSPDEQTLACGIADEKTLLLDVRPFINPEDAQDPQEAKRREWLERMRQEGLKPAKK